MKAVVYMNSVGDKIEFQIRLSTKRHLLVIIHKKKPQGDHLEGPMLVRRNIIRREGDVQVNVDKPLTEELLHLAGKLTEARVSLLPAEHEADRLLWMI